MQVNINGNVMIEIDDNKLYLYFDGNIITSEDLRQANISFDESRTITIGRLTLLRRWLSDEIINAILNSIKIRF